jgi:hypothetical protein
MQARTRAPTEALCRAPRALSGLRRIDNEILRSNRSRLLADRRNEPGFPSGGVKVNSKSIGQTRGDGTAEQVIAYLKALSALQTYESLESCCPSQ